MDHECRKPCTFECHTKVNAVIASPPPHRGETASHRFSIEPAGRIRMILTRKIGFLLLLPVLGALATLGVFYSFHIQTADDAPIINLAGRQRLLAQQLFGYAHMVREGQEEDRATLLDLTNLYDSSLAVIEHGGEIMGQTFPPAPPEVLDEIAEIRKAWRQQAATLRAIARLPAQTPDMEDAYRAAELNTPPLVAAADKVVTALAQRNQTLQRRTLNVLLGSAAFNFLLLLSGIFITRQYITEQKRIEGALRETAERRRLLMESANDAIFVADVETGRIVECNKKASELIGLPPEQIVGLHQSELHPPEQAERYRRLFRDNSRPEGALVKDVLVQHRSGRQIPVEISASTLELDGRTFVHGIFHDVSERRRMDEALHALAAGASGPAGRDFLNTLVCQLGRTLGVDYALVAESADGETARTVAVCAHGQVADNFEYPLQGTPCYNVLNGNFCHHPSGVAQEFPDDKLLAEMQIESYMGIPLIDAGGHTLGLLAVLGRQPLANPEFAESVFQVFATRAANELERKHAETALRQSEERLQHLVHYDPLTQLPNRVLFLDRLNQALARARWHKRLVAVLFLDLDRFKVINDTVGHPIGDRVLRAIAERLSRTVREGDTVARLGGDEFAVALADLAEVSDVPRVTEKIIAALGPPVVIDEREYFVTASIGVSLHPEDGDNAEMLLRNADIAMYRAKETGKNNFQFYSPTMNAEAPRRLTLETDLRRALERREFLLHYQPKVDLASGWITGTEALLRWQHPKQGLISPLDFIPLLEETGLIVPVGRWVLHSACVQNKSWQEAGHAPLRVAVNLSARQFKQTGLVEMVEEVLAETGLDPRYLELELTESILLEHTEESLATLRRIHDMGIHLALDDFGTGYSSLSYLKRFPIDSLKIDRSFIRDVTTNPDDATIAQTVIAMAHSLRMTAVAEGVETEEQLAFLRSHQCDQMQGYYFSRPLPPELFAQMMKENRSLTTEP